MQLERTTLHNMGPFKHLEVDLSAFGDALLIAIVGPNGIGKSSFLEMAFAGALYRECQTQGTLKDRARARDSYLESTLTNGSTYTMRHSVDAVSGKAETLLLDAAKRPVLKGTSVKAFDAWSARHMPPPELLFASIFGVQGAGGFLTESPGDRKAILLRALGIEHLETLAKQARDHAASVKIEIEKLRARIHDEELRGGFEDAIRLEIATLDASVESTEAALEAARSDLAIARSGAPTLELRRREALANREKRAELGMRIAARNAEIAQLELRVRNNREVLADADKIRTAKARSDEIGLEIQRLGLDRTVAESTRDEAKRDRERFTAAEKAAEQRAADAEQRAVRARGRLADRAKVDDAIVTVPRLENALQSAQSAEVAASAALETIRGERLAGADERIAGLRGGLDCNLNDARRARQGVYDGTLEALSERIEETVNVVLDRDDRYVTTATELPARLKAAEAALAVARAAEQSAKRALDAARALSARSAELDVADQEVTDATEARRIAEGDALAALNGGRDATDRVHTHEQKRATVQKSIDVFQREQTELQPLASKAAPLENAEGRLAELEPQLATVRRDVETLVAAKNAVPEPEQEPEAPNVVDLEQRVQRAKEAHDGASEALTLARGRLERAIESRQLVATMVEKLAPLEADLGDWTRLSDELGRDGLQAAEIDCAGPELTELTNDLLRTCLGPRWTVSIETTRLSSDGKREIDDCIVNVLDTVSGREADAKKFSGGERVLLGEAISLALTMLACRRSGLQRVTLVRDESGAALDPANARAYTAMLRRAAELVNASHILFVSHVREVIELADDVLDVRDYESNAA